VRRVADEPTNGDIAVELGIEFARRGDYGGAMRQFNRALSIDPNNVEALYQRSGVMLVKGSFPEAYRGFEQVNRLRPGYRKTYQYLATIARRLGSPIKADEYEKLWQAQVAAGGATEE
jgi:tetratricopeptide (TPR) repeat protein